MPNYSGMWTLQAQMQAQGAGTTWLNISGGWYVSSAIKTDGTLWTWGANPFGNLGQNNLVYRSSPVQVGAGTTWLNVECGNYHTLATTRTTT